MSFAYAKKRCFRWAISLLCVLGSFNASSFSSAAPIVVPYSGRLVADDGRPVDGPVDLTFEFFGSESSRVSLVGLIELRGVVLDGGVFQGDLSPFYEEFNRAMPNTIQTLWLQVTNLSSDKVYPRQQIGAVPMALKVPINESAWHWDENGRLAIRNDFSTRKVGGESVVTSGAPSGQVLACDPIAKAWKPASAGSGTVKSVAAGLGLSGGTITNSGTLAIANGGVVTTMVADSAITGQKIADGGVTFTKLAPCANEKYLKVSGGAWVCADVVTSSGGDIINGGQGGPVTIGVNDSSVLTFETNNSAAMTIDSLGQIGLGTSIPGVKLDINGQVRTSTFDNTGLTTVDWNKGNIQFTTDSCQGGLVQ
jgi:hypothetical protein